MGQSIVSEEKAENMSILKKTGSVREMEKETLTEYLG
ncbi:hypothetical protein SDC9_114993 [bioreactor metagenome]|uniref:Uncharacterized protein n=1 Tax=bioreactor metagenome TaxID=1076179 RepID=A0A645BS59_9ZZZZ